MDEKKKLPRAHREILGRFESLVALYLEIEKKPRRYGTSEYLTSGEIHLIEAVGDFDGTLSVTDLASHGKVTKGAISQALKRLEQKGLTEKEPDPANASRVLVALTSKGKSAYYAHKHWHEEMDGGYFRYLSGIEDKQVDFLLQYMKQVESFLRSVLEEDS